MVTTAALVSVSDYSGVTLELSASYLNAARDGDVVDVDARVLKHGGAVAVLACTLTARGTGRTVAEGRHTKCVRAGAKALCVRTRSFRRPHAQRGTRYLPRTEVTAQLARMLQDAQQPRAKL